MSVDPYIGEVMLFAGNFAPRGWALCDGSLLAIASNQALFSILGTTYGGDGRTTFALPDLRGRVPINPGTGPGLSHYTWGEKSGQYETTLAVGQMPSHHHEIKPACDDTNANAGSPGNGYPGADPGGVANATYSTTGPDAMASWDTDTTGGSQPVNIMKPFLGVNYWIALVGIYPSRN